MKNEKTKKVHLKYVFFKTISIALTVMPLIVYVVLGLISGDIHKGKKVILGFTCIIAIILSTINILMKHHLRSPLFLVLLGLYYTIENALPLFIAICVGVILDEFIFTPLTIKYKSKYTINKEIDERL